jgi:hypothetical protein
MTTTDWILDIALLLVVFRQIREGRIDARFVLIPLGIVGWAVHNYVHTIPTAGNDLALLGVFVVIGAALGIGGGVATRVRYDGQHALAQAGFVAAALWVVGMGMRMAFQLWVEHGGAPTVAHFSAAHDITGSDAWVAALLMMALTEVVTRIGVIVLRAYRLHHLATPSRSAALV